MSTTTITAVLTPTDIAVREISNVMHGEATATFDVTEFERLCREHQSAKKLKEAAVTTFDQAQAELQLFVDKHGTIPPNAEKTMRCESPRFQADVTRGVTTEINDARVTELAQLLKRLRLSWVFNLLFAPRIEYSLVPGADKAIKEAKLPKKAKEAIYACYAICFTPKPKAAQLKVTDLHVAAQRAQAAQEARAMKAANAKKGGR